MERKDRDETQDTKLIERMSWLDADVKITKAERPCEREMARREKKKTKKREEKILKVAPANISAVAARAVWIGYSRY